MLAGCRQLLLSRISGGRGANVSGGGTLIPRRVGRGGNTDIEPWKYLRKFVQKHVVEFQIVCLHCLGSLGKRSWRYEQARCRADADASDAKTEEALGSQFTLLRRRFRSQASRMR